MATALFYRMLVSETKAVCDQEHLHVIIDGDSTIPDRTWAIESQHTEVLCGSLKKSAHRLIRAGAELLVMPCNTAHVVYNEVVENLPVPFLNIVTETRKELALSGCTRPCLLATRGTLRSGLYQEALSDMNVLLPSEEETCEVHTAIEYIKGARIEEARSILTEVVISLVAKGADGVVFGCTDIPLALEGEHISVPVFDTTRILARASVRECGAHLREYSVEGKA
ncbi:MAG: amino acid racemase [Nitrospira sp.]|nr:amino acid racemase [Nitrospira sp.]